MVQHNELKSYHFSYYLHILTSDLSNPYVAGYTLFPIKPKVISWLLRWIFKVKNYYSRIIFLFFVWLFLQLSPGRDVVDEIMEPSASQSQDCEPTPPLHRHGSKTNFYLPPVDTESPRNYSARPRGRSVLMKLSLIIK